MLSCYISTSLVSAIDYIIAPLADYGQISEQSLAVTR